MHDEDTVVVIYDRYLPGSEHTDISALVRAATYTYRLVVMTTDRIDLDILGIDCDDIVQKPAFKGTVSAVIEGQFNRLGEATTDHELHGLVEKRTMLEANVSAAVLAESERYVELCT